MNDTKASLNKTFLMVNVSAKLLKNSQEKCIGINDLKTQFRGIKYTLLTLKKVVKKQNQF